jgi:signal transduction histidine kinase
MDNDSGSYKIRPAGRHILTIGRDLIQDGYAAVVELVKNAFDADSPDVDIEFKANTENGNYTITIIDHGHGMSRETVVNKWMVPSTRDKLDRRKSPSGRIMQGRKGVGRYAVSILGRDLLLETVTNQGEKTTLLVEWDSFEDAQYLDDVEILIETIKVTEAQGTRLTISGDSELLQDWNKSQFNKLRFELKKLTPPLSPNIDDHLSEDVFQINLKIDDFPNFQNIEETIKPYPLIELFDYKISGKIDKDGKGILSYSQQKARNTTTETINFDLENPTGCGELVLDISVYDREKEAIESLISRGLKDEEGEYVGKLQARQLLNDYNGIGVYRNGFRIRPLGDADFDWLKLNEQRVQNPSLRIGSNQVIGFVQIQSDELSGLVEKSARDGLKENTAFHQLKIITKIILAKLEERRFDYRRKAGLSRSVVKIEKELEQLFSFDSLQKDISSKLTEGGMDNKIVQEVVEIIRRDANTKNKVADDIRQTVAIYQGQATLGKIINVILHEGRRPLSYFRNQIPNFNYYYDTILKTKNIEKLQQLLPIAEGISQNADVFVQLFSRLDPLAAGKRSAKKPIDLKQTIINALAIFNSEVKKNNIIVKIEGSEDFQFTSWQQDIYAIFTNLVDNSIFWMNEKQVSKKEISILMETDGKTLLHIDYRDTGPGIEPNLIVNGAIFEPEFSTKPTGTGLGLAIAGEAASRNGLELTALESEFGVWFRLLPKMEDE